MHMIKSRYFSSILLILIMLGSPTLIWAQTLTDTRRPAPVDPEVRRQIMTLRQTAMSGDPDESLDALKQLEALGEPAHDTLTPMVRQLLARDTSGIQAAARTAGSDRIQEGEKKLFEMRQQARDHISKLTKDGAELQEARRTREQLLSLTRQFDRVMQLRAQTLVAVKRRELLLKLHQTLDSRPDDRYTVEHEQAIRTDAEAALGFSWSTAISFPGLDSKRPSDPVQSHLWTWLLNRATDAHNRKVLSVMNTQEAINAKLVNEYREAIGLPQLEWDARLVQAARRHSKEMVDLGFFSHNSPTDGLKSFSDREKKAGYDKPGGENIAQGYMGGEHVFWGWFDSPGHHKNMCRDGFTALGVGQWGNTWTQNFGSGKRLAFVSEDEFREKGKPLGDILPKQGR